MKFQVVAVRDLSGISKERQRPYVMRIVSGVFTNADGTCEVGEVTFMQSESRPLPQLDVGKSYQPVVSGRARQGKLQFEITELKPLAAPAAARAA